MGLARGGYALPDDHVDRAFTDLLYEAPVSALALGCYFLRNDGFVLVGEPTAQDVIAGFRAKFDYGSDAEDEFARLFTTDVPDDDGFSWFDNFAVDSQQSSVLNEGPTDV